MNKKTLYILILSITIFYLNDLRLFSKGWNNKEALPANPGIGRLDPVLSGVIYVRFSKNLSIDNNVTEILDNFGIKLIKPLIKPEESYSNKKSLNHNLNLSNIINAEEPLLRTYIAEYNTNFNPEVICEKLINYCDIFDAAVPYYLPKIFGSFSPNDSMLANQPMLATIKAFEAWGLCQGDSNVVIGISDSGVLQDHEDLKDNIRINYKEIPDNGIDDDGNGFIDDYSGVNFSFADDSTKPGNTTNTSEGHGTGVSGLADAVTNNTKGIASVGFKCRFFPMKTMVQGKSELGIVYGYQAIIYAGQNGIKVVNCSWGGQTYSCVNESMIKYAESLDVSIVAAAGNNNSKLPFYPAAYEGVLGVGASDPSDTLYIYTNYGHYVDIIAPGQKSFTTSSAGVNLYGGFCCTSGAAPIISGAVALARSKFPKLDNLQALQLVRISTDNIEQKNDPKYKGLIPGRINLLKMLMTDPDSVPAVSPISAEFLKGTYKSKSERYSVNDTIYPTITVKNYLGEGKKFHIKMSVIQDTTNSIIMVDSSLNLTDIPSSKELVLPQFSFKLLKIIDQIFNIRIDLTDDYGYADYFIIPFNPMVNYSNFSNNTIAFTAVDEGRLGFADPYLNNKGIGFRYKTFCNILSEGGLVISNDSSELISQFRNSPDKPADEFLTVKPYYGNNENIAIFNDNAAQKPLGLQIQSDIKVFDSLPCARINYTITNNSLTSLKNLAASYFLDWDIDDGSNNLSGVISNYIFGGQDRVSGGGLYIKKDEKNPYIGTFVFSQDPSAEAQYANIDNYLTWTEKGVSDSLKLIFLNSGKQYSQLKATDLVISAGMKFKKTFESGSNLKFSMCLCGADNLNQLELYLRYAVDTTQSSIMDDFKESENIDIYPNPAHDLVNINLLGFNIISSIEVINYLGEYQISAKPDNSGNNKNIFTIPTSYLVSGLYIISIYADNKYFYKPIIIIH